MAEHLEVHGFLGMLGSVDCIHWPWRNYPTAWQGQYNRGAKETPRLCLKHLLHMICGFETLTLDPPVRTTTSTYSMNLTHSTSSLKIELLWSTLPLMASSLQRTTKFKCYQDAVRKDVERAFEVLQGRFQILTHGACPMSINKIKRMMYYCVILHNMVVDHNGRAISPLDLELIPEERPARTWEQRVGTQLRMMGELRDRVTHNRLQVALVEHIWNLPQNNRQR
uniref:uncharacterized protein LOC122597254 n=1 Tax=Erigeron canadensis TaxID=72917 RepID=UPI001CB8F2C8|nr:uncharacterized protein LOC122597254 [Erigeron canadensis]